MEKLKRMGGKLIVCACEVAVGVVLLIDPETFTEALIRGLGILLCVVGVLATLAYFRMDPEEAALSQELTRGLVELALGVLFIYKAGWIVTKFMPITVLYGLTAALTGIVKLQWTVDMIRLKRGMWQSSAVAAALSILIAVVVLSNPFRVRHTLWVFTAVALIITGAADLVTAVFSQKQRSYDSSES